MIAPRPTCPACGALAHRLGICLACRMNIAADGDGFSLRPLTPGGWPRHRKELALMAEGVYEYGSHKARAVREVERDDGLRPVPLRRELRPTDVVHHRVDGCPRYEDCLMRAGIEAWRSWSCYVCPVRIELTGKAESTDPPMKGRAAVGFYQASPGQKKAPDGLPDPSEALNTTHEQHTMRA